MGKYSKEDASKDTGDSTKQVSSAWHDARETASKEGNLKERPAGGRGPRDECNYGHKK